MSLFVLMMEGDDVKVLAAVTGQRIVNVKQKREREREREREIDRESV